MVSLPCHFFHNQFHKTDHSSSIYTGPVLGWASSPSETTSSVHPCNSKGIKSSKYKYLDHGLTNDLHPLKLPFHPIPIRLDILCVDPTGRINIVQCVVHDTGSLVGATVHSYLYVYAAHSSLYTVFPALTCCCMIGSNVAADLLGTTLMTP